MKTTSVGEAHRKSFRDLLQQELALRCTANPQYSLRAFAKTLCIDHSTLSQILRGKRRLTEETIRALAGRLNLAESEIESFVTLEARLGSADAWERHVRQLQEEALEVIAQWHHFAILELTRLENFRPDCRWIARVLDISVDDVNMALTRLLHLGLLMMVDRQTWIDVSENASARFEQLPAAVARELSARIGRVAQGTGSDRLLSSSTIAVDRERIAIVSSYLEKVRRDVASLFGGEGARDDVYQLDILFYPLTRLHQENDNGAARDAVSDSREKPGQGGEVLR